MDIEDTIDGSHPYSKTLCATSFCCDCLSQPLGNLAESCRNNNWDL